MTTALDPSDFGFICRVCARKRELKSIFSLTGDKTVAHKMAVCTGETFEIGDGLPGGICSDCSGTLNTVWMFRETCARSAALFRNSLRSFEDIKCEFLDMGLQDDNYFQDEDSEIVSDVTASKPASSRLMQCPFCGLRSLDKYALERHTIEQHSFTREQGFNCYACEAVFPDAAERALHEANSCRNMRPGSLYHCRLCHQKLHSRQLFDSHLESHRTRDVSIPFEEVQHEGGGSKVYHCPWCQYCTRNLDQADAHRLRHRGLRPYGCPLCPFRSDLRSSLASHSLRHRRAPRLRCALCPARALRHAALRAHMRKHKRWDKCTRCSMTFDSKQKLLQHAAEEHGCASFLCCHKCGRCFIGEKSLKKHVDACAKPEPVDVEPAENIEEEDLIMKVDPNADIKKELEANEEGKMLDKSTEMEYTCDSCPYTTSKKRLLACHMRRHAVRRKHRCKLCPFRTRHPDSLKAHARTHLTPFQFQCSECEESFPELEDLQRHSSQHHTTTPNLWDMDGKVDVKPRTENIHCKICGISCPGEAALSEHSKRHEEAVMIPCRLCPFRAPTAVAARRHARRHKKTVVKSNPPPAKKSKRTFSCSSCSKIFPGMREMRVHVSEQHEELMRFCCELCGARYLSAGGYYPHVKSCRARRDRAEGTATPATPHVRKPKGSDPAFICEICGQVLGSVSAYRAHVRRHEGRQRVYTCARCPYTTAYSEAIRAHRLRHAGAKPYACGQCEYRTEMASSLRMHQRRHAGDLRHACALCPFRAVNVSNLKRHMAKHTNSRPHKCELCEKSFFEKRTLADHVSSKHDGVKPYCCHLCSVPFSSAKGIQRHLRKFHPGVPSHLSSLP